MTFDTVKGHIPMSDIVIKAWYHDATRKPGFVRYAVAAETEAQARQDVLKHMAGGFGIPGEKWVVPQRVLIIVS